MDAFLLLEDYLVLLAEDGEVLLLEDASHGDPLPPPTALTYDRDTGTLAWQGIACADGYRVTGGSGPRGDRALLEDTEDLSANVGPLASDDLRTFAVTALYDEDLGQPSAPLFVAGPGRRRLT